jgi:hypothetical protein
MFSRARPAASSGAPVSAMRVPAQTVAVPASASASIRPPIRSSESRMPSVAQTAVNECPLPATLTGPLLPATTSASSASRRGVAICSGVHATSPDQLRHVVAIVPLARRADRTAIRPCHFGNAIDWVSGALHRSEVTMMPLHTDRPETGGVARTTTRTETIRNDGRPCPCGRVSVVTVRGAETVTIVRNPRNGAFQVVACDEVEAGGAQGYRVSLQRAM